MLSFVGFQKMIESLFFMPLYPDIVLSDLFYEDFKTGLRGLTLKELERPIIVHKINLREQCQDTKASHA
jgi:hypothetical protein